MSSQLVINNAILQIDENIEYVFNTSNIADMSLSKSNYTQAFKIPRLLRDTVRTFDELGFPADSSALPYSVNKVDALDNYSKIYSGNLVVLRTTREYYESTVISGTFDIFNALGNKTFADIPEVVAALPLKTVSNVGTLITAPKGPAIFAIANYGGITHVDDGTNISINVDCMPVAYEIRFLWDAIFRFIGIPSYITDDVPNLDNQYYTFPYPPYKEVISSDAIRFSGINTSAAGNSAAGVNPPGSNTFTNVTAIGWNVSGRQLTCTSGGQFIIEFPNGFIGQYFKNLANPRKGLNVVLTKNGNEIARFKGYTVNQSDRQPFKHVETFVSGDVLNYRLEVDPEDNFAITWFTGDNLMTISTTKVDDDAVKEMLNSKLSDYVKEFMYRFGLIGFAADNSIVFKNVQNIINSTPYDWSDKYNRRVEETYDIGWNQNNYLKHKYVSENSDYFDLNINIFDKNVPPSRDIIKSNVYVPSQNISKYPIGGTMTNPIEKEVRAYITYTADSNNNVKTENRNFWLQANVENASSVNLASYTMTDKVTLTNVNIYVARNFDYTFKNSQVWDSMRSLVDFARLHTIELNLNMNDIANLIQYRTFYFKQESGYYMLQELRYKKGSIATGKFLRIKNIKIYYQD